MKNYKLISALAIVTLLSACGTKNASGAKMPKFAKEGKEVERADFFKSFDEKYDLLDFNSDKHIVSSKKMTSTYDYYSKFVIASSEGIRVSNVQNNSDEKNIEADVDNYMLSYSGKSTSVSDSKSANGSYDKSTGSQSFKMQSQKIEYRDQEYFTDVDLMNNIVYLYDVVDDSHLLGDTFDSYLKDGLFYTLGINELNGMLEDAKDAPETDLPLFKFSINKNTYTCNYSFEEVYKQKDGEDNLIYSKTTKDTIKVQVTMDDNDFKLVTYITHSEKREFEQEATFNGYKIKPGEYVEINGSDARVTIIKDAKVNLSLVDTTGFEILAW